MALTTTPEILREICAGMKTESRKPSPRYTRLIQDSQFRARDGRETQARGKKQAGAVRTRALTDEEVSLVGRVPEIAFIT